MIFLSGDKIECSLALIALTFAAFLAAFDSITWIATISGIYIVGVLWGTKLLQFLGLNLKKISYASNLKRNAGESCGVCGGNACKRHKPSRNYLRVNVPKDFDDALENLLENLLQTYVCAWYSEFSSDEAFVQQFRTSIATAAGNIAQRLFHLDTAAVIFDHLVPVALQHAQDWKVLVNRSKNQGGKPLDYAADYLGPRIHPAAYSRDAELNYLRGLVTTLMPHLLPTTHFSVNNKIILREILANWVLLPAMDALADSNNINTLVILSTYHEGTFGRNSDSVNVPLLHSWAMPPLILDKVSNSLKPSLEEVLNNPQLLYIFMQHIKETGPVHLLQFCLDIDDLSKRMLNPDMNVETEEDLYAAAQTLYSSYLIPETPNYLHLPIHISEGLKKILEGGKGKIQELRTSRPLYQAHQEAHTLLEITCLPSFHHSYRMYTLLCGQQSTVTAPKSSNHSQSVAPGMGSRLSNQIGKIQRVLRTSAVDGAPYQSDNVYQAEEVDCSTRLHRFSNSYEEEGSRDLTAWRVTIPEVDGRGAQPLYMIAVHSVSQNKSWTVLRRDIDFYTLRNRLAEFHGDRELNDSPLPARKNQHPSLNTNRQRYQDFLQKLLAKPKLRSSELLHTFLTALNIEQNISSYSIAPDIGLFYQNVAHKLRKERGQHLDKFMNTFINSINIKNEHMDFGVEPNCEQTRNSIEKKGRDLIHIGSFNNNLNLHKKHQDFQFVSNNQPQHVRGATFCIAEAVDKLLQVSPALSRVFWLIATLSYKNLDPIVNQILNETLVKLLSGGRAAIVVKLLNSNIFGSKLLNEKDNSTADSNENKFKQALNGLSSLFPWWTFKLHSTWRKLMKSLLEPLQSPQFNKQLAYSLLDQIIADLFPEISQ